MSSCGIPSEFVLIPVFFLFLFDFFPSPSTTPLPSAHLPLCTPVISTAIPFLHSRLPPWRLLDELYAQKLKYKAISEELDHALNDMTSM